MIVFRPVTKPCEVCDKPVTSMSANLRWCPECRIGIEAQQERRRQKKYYMRRKAEERRRKEMAA